MQMSKESYNKDNVDMIFTPCPEKKLHFIFDYNAHLLADLYYFYTIGNRNEHSPNINTCNLLT